MLRFLATLGFLAAATTTANANQYVDGTIVSVEPYYANSTRRIPQTICRQVNIPVYQNNNNAGNVLTGAIIGGIIGNNIVKGEGSGAAGAVIGGLLGSQQNNGNVVQYQRQNRCHTEYHNEVETFISHYFITVDVNGFHVRQQTGTAYNVGDTIKMKVFYSFD